MIIYISWWKLCKILVHACTHTHVWTLFSRLRHQQHAYGVLMCSNYELRFNYTVCYLCWLVLWQMFVLVAVQCRQLLERLSGRMWLTFCIMWLLAVQFGWCCEQRPCSASWLLPVLAVWSMTAAADVLSCCLVASCCESLTLVRKWILLVTD